VIRGAVRRAQPLVRKSRGRTWILGYHLVDGKTGLTIDLDREQFVNQLDGFIDRAEVMGLSALVEELRSGAFAVQGDRPRVVLTFDDAFLNFRQVVFPLLASRGLPATLFVPAGFINGESGCHPFSDVRFQDTPPMTWAHLQEVQAAGVEIGSHAYSPRNLTGLRSAALTDELAKSQTEITARLGVRPTFVCYPRSCVSADVARAASRFYTAGVTGGGRPVSAADGRDLLRLPRLPVRSYMSAEILMGVLEQSVHLEEWVADRTRRLRSQVARPR